MGSPTPYLGADVDFAAMTENDCPLPSHGNNALAATAATLSGAGIIADIGGDIPDTPPIPPPRLRSTLLRCPLPADLDRHVVTHRVLNRSADTATSPPVAGGAEAEKTRDLLAADLPLPPRALEEAVEGEGAKAKCDICNQADDVRQTATKNLASTPLLDEDGFLILLDTPPNEQVLAEVRSIAKAKRATMSAERYETAYAHFSSLPGAVSRC